MDANGWNHALCHITWKSWLYWKLQLRRRLVFLLLPPHKCFVPLKVEILPGKSTFGRIIYLISDVLSNCVYYWSAWFRRSGSELWDTWEPPKEMLVDTDYTRLSSNFAHSPLWLFASWMFFYLILRDCKTVSYLHKSASRRHIVQFSHGAPSLTTSVEYAGYIGSKFINSHKLCPLCRRHLEYWLRHQLKYPQQTIVMLAT